MLYIYGMINARKVERVNATIQEELLSYLDDYASRHGVRSRSQALNAAIRALREKELEEGYRALAAAIERGEETYPPFLADGLDTPDEKAWS